MTKVLSKLSVNLATYLVKMQSWKILRIWLREPSKLSLTITKGMERGQRKDQFEKAWEWSSLSQSAKTLLSYQNFLPNVTDDHCYFAAAERQSRHVCRISRSRHAPPPRLLKGQKLRKAMPILSASLITANFFVCIPTSKCWLSSTYIHDFIIRGLESNQKRGREGQSMGTDRYEFIESQFSD